MTDLLFLSDCFFSLKSPEGLRRPSFSLAKSRQNPRQIEGSAAQAVTHPKMICLSLPAVITYIMHLKRYVITPSLKWKDRFYLMISPKDWPY